MRLDVRAYALASGAVVAVFGTLCAAAIAFNAKGFMAVVGYLAHVDLSPLARAITWTSYLVGITAWTALFALWGGTLAWLYNRLSAGAQAGPGERVSISPTLEREKTRR